MGEPSSLSPSRLIRSPSRGFRSGAAVSNPAICDPYRTPHGLDIVRGIAGRRWSRRDTDQTLRAVPETSDFTWLMPQALTAGYGFLVHAQLARNLMAAGPSAP